MTSTLTAEQKELEKQEKVKAKRYKAMKSLAGTKFPDFSLISENSSFYKTAMISALNYVNYCYDNKEVAEFANDYSTSVLGFSVKHVPDHELTSLGHFSWLVHNGAWFPDTRKEEIAQKFKEISNFYKKQQESEVKQLPKSELIEKKQTTKLCEFLEGLIDDYVFYNKPDCKKVTQLISEFPKANLKKLYDRFSVSLGEEDRTGLTEQEIARLDWLKQEILGSLQETPKQIQKKVRQVTNRKPKKINPFKLVQRLNYLQNYPELKLISISPEKIIGSTVLFVYNVKTRKLGRYVSTSTTGFSVKGSSLLNYSETDSVCKTLRKPEETLPKIMETGKVEQKKVMDTIKSKNSVLTGRLNKDTILLKVF